MPARLPVISLNINYRQITLNVTCVIQIIITPYFPKGKIGCEKKKENPSTALCQFRITLSFTHMLIHFLNTLAENQA